MVVKKNVIAFMANEGRRLVEERGKMLKWVATVAGREHLWLTIAPETPQLNLIMSPKTTTGYRLLIELFHLFQIHHSAKEGLALRKTSMYSEIQRVGRKERERESGVGALRRTPMYSDI